MKNKKVLITGSSRGLGRHIAIEFAKNNCNIIIHGTKKGTEICKTLEQIKKHNVIIKTVFADLSNKHGLDNIKKYISAEKPNIFINNAALYNDKDAFKQIGVNLISPVILINHISKIMAKINGGIIININSIAGKIPNYKEAVYCASKFGLRGFSESVKYEMLKQKVKIIDIYPGAINTGMSSGRKDKNNLIDPIELSKFIFTLTETKSFSANDINFTKTKY